MKTRSSRKERTEREDGGKRQRKMAKGGRMEAGTGRDRGGR